MAKNPPTVRMRRLGTQLRKIREDRGLTLDEAANLLKLSKSALNRMENAQVIVRPYETEYLLGKYEVTDDDLRDSLLGLASAGRSKEWVKRYGELSPGSRSRISSCWSKTPRRSESGSRSVSRGSCRRLTTHVRSRAQSGLIRRGMWSEL
jgi:transcriptional regulator with XRE-family HTH domain